MPPPYKAWPPQIKTSICYGFHGLHSGVATPPKLAPPHCPPPKRLCVETPLRPSNHIRCYTTVISAAITLLTCCQSTLVHASKQPSTCADVLKLSNRAPIERFSMPQMTWQTFSNRARIAIVIHLLGLNQNARNCESAEGTDNSLVTR
jgi:hypothetical protein